MKVKGKIILVIAITGLLTACDEMFDYSPYVIDFDSNNQDVNQKNIEKLRTRHNNDTITIAFTGDTHRFFDQTDAFVNKVNEDTTIDFVVHVGDLADFGLPKQYLWGNSYLLKLHVPYFVVVGNHDLVGNGLTAYNEMFGGFNYSFIYDKIKFVFINTNGLEFKFNGEVPDILWLEEQVKPDGNFTKAVVIFHIPPMDVDFDASLKESFEDCLAKYNNVLFTVHGHLHGHEIYKPYKDSITYVNVYGVENMKFNLIRISNSQFDVETVEF